LCTDAAISVLTLADSAAAAAATACVSIFNFASY
jgi:hypothetical protein